MKRQITSLLLVLGIALSLLLPCFALAGSQFPLQFDKKEKWIGPDKFITYPMLVAKDPALLEIAEKINRQITQTAHISEYLNLLSSLETNDSGFTMTYDILGSEGYVYGKGYLSILISIRGQMQSHPPAQADYPMTFSLASGERVPFDELFIDPAGAKAYIEDALRSSLSQDLADCFENNQLLPVPYQQFALSGEGHITFYYSKDQLSYKSGAPGAVSFRFSELWDYLDTSASGIPMSMMRSPYGTPIYPKVHQPVLAYAEYLDACVRSGQLAGLYSYMFPAGSTIEHAFKYQTPTGNAMPYPAGAYYYRLENPEFCGTLILTNEEKTLVTGFLAHRVDACGIETGRTSLSEAMQRIGLPATTFPINHTDAQRFWFAKEAPLHISIRMYR